MEMEIRADAEAVARRAASIIAADAHKAVAARGHFILAVSGGHTPWIMLRALADEDVPWDGLHLVQVDERVATDGDPDRNWTHLRDSLLDRVPLRPEQVHPMPVPSPDLEAAVAQYAQVLEEIAGQSPLLDLVHLLAGEIGQRLLGQPRRDADTQAPGDELDQRPAPRRIERIEPHRHQPRPLQPRGL